MTLYSKPFLKWAGGKTKLAPQIRNLLPKENRLVEPFLGAGSIFLNTDYKSYLLADNNPNLITLFQTLVKLGDKFIKQCYALFIAKNHNTSEYYYERRKEFNASKDPVRRSCLFVYLNRHCFNGLWRVNRSGKHNVSFGKYKTIYFPRKEMEFFVNKARQTDTIFICSDYKEILKKVIEGDVVYCDPPYVPLSETANFTSYSANGFSDVDQRELTTQIVQLSSQNIPVLISNHDVPFTRDLYKDASKKVYLDVRRNISRNAESRKTKAKEVMALFLKEKEHISPSDKLHQS